MAQQTAVEWLVNELLFIQSLKEGEITESNKGILTTSTIEQAKQMEKEQIIEGFYEGMKTNLFDPNRGRGKMYYDETYKKD